MVSVDPEFLRTILEILMIVGGALSVVLGLRVTYKQLLTNAIEVERRLNDHTTRISGLETKMAVVETRLELGLKT